MISGTTLGGVVRGVGGGLNDHEFVISKMGGVAGERANRSTAGTFTFVDILRGAEIDYKDAVSICTTDHIRSHAQKAKTPDRYLNECLKEAHNIIVFHKSAHTALVEALLQHNFLTYAECLSIWNQYLLGSDATAARPEIQAGKVE